MLMLLTYLTLLSRWPVPYGVPATQAAALRPAAPLPLSFQATLDAIKITAEPGQVVTRQFRLTLDRDQRPTHFKARVEDWWRSDDGQQSFYDAPGTLRRSCSPWVSINPMEATVEPGDTLTIRITVALPAELASGGFWCALTVDEVPDPMQPASEGVGVRFIASVSTGIFVNIQPVHRDLAILGIDVTNDEALVKVRNDGNVPLGIDGRLEFFTAAGTTPLATSTINRGTVLTEPSRLGRLSSRLPAVETLPSGRYRLRAVLDFGATHYLGAEIEVDIVREGKPSDPPR